MAEKLIRFGVELDRKTDEDFKDVARVERRSKRNMLQVLLRRVIAKWREQPAEMERMGLIRRSD